MNKEKAKRNQASLYQRAKTSFIAKKNKARQHADFHWFVDHYMELYNHYGETYLVIKNKHVLAVADTYKDGVAKGKETEKLGTFIVQYCNGTEKAYITQTLQCR